MNKVENKVRSPNVGGWLNGVVAGLVMNGLSIPTNDLSKNGKPNDLID